MILPGCVFGEAGIGGMPRQCARPVFVTYRVKADDQPASESMPLCERHADTLDDAGQGTIYREQADGTPYPVRVWNNI